jgi:catalase-peroxidase
MRSPAAWRARGPPTRSKWDNNYFDNLFGYEWELTKSPAGAQQWTPKNGAAAGTVPDAHDPSKKHAPIMFTTDLALRFDPSYEKISKRFHENPEEFADAFAKAWYKLTHRDMGPIVRYLGPLVPRSR